MSSPIRPHLSSRNPTSPLARELNPEALQNDPYWADERAVPLTADDETDRTPGERIDHERTGITAGGEGPPGADDLDDFVEQIGAGAQLQGDVGMDIGNDADRMSG